ARQQELVVKGRARSGRVARVAEAGDEAQTIKHPVDGLELRIPMAGLFDLAAERTRLAKERGKIDAELQGLRGRLANPQFLERAKAEGVEESRARVSELERGPAESNALPGGIEGWLCAARSRT